MTSARVAIERIDNNRGEKLVIDGSRAETYLSSGKYKEGDIELKDLLDKLRYKNGILSDIHGIWRPSNCAVCGQCDGWIWSEGNIMYFDDPRTDNVDSKGTVVDVTDIGQHTPKYGKKSYYVKKYKVIEDDSGNSFTLTTFYDPDKNEVTVILFEYPHDGSNYRLHKCSNF